MAKQITGSTTKPLAMKAGEQQVITIAKGQQLRIQELINGQMKAAGKVMSSRKGQDLQVKFLDGTELVVKDFFEVCQGDACSVTLGDSQLGSFTITADTPLGNQLPDGTHLVHYSLSDASSLMDLAAAGGEFIKTSTATVAQAATPAVIEGAAVAQAATLSGGSNLLWAGLGLALAAGGGGGGPGVTPAPILPDGFKGVVWDTPVSNAIVFRDLNGDGIWDANEPITITDKDGKYEGLTGEGNIVATSLDRLLWRATATYVEYVSVVTNNVSVATPTTKTIEFVFEGAPFGKPNSSTPGEAPTAEQIKEFAEKILDLIDPENQYLNGGQTRYNSAEKLTELDSIIAKMGVDILPYITGFTLAPLTFAGKVFEKNSDLVAIDIGANLENESTGNLPSGDDFVWSGTYVIGAPLQDGEVSVHVTAVSTLVKAYMDVNGGTAAQALAAIKAGLDFDQSSGTGANGSNTKILTGELNAQITRLMGEVIARAEAEDFSSVDQKSMIDEITATLETLAAAIKLGNIGKIDLTNPEHLSEIFKETEAGLILSDEYEAQALALQIGASGPATNSVWHTETAPEVRDIYSNVDDSADATLATDEVVGNITVLARHDAVSEYDGVSLDVTGDENDSAFLQSSRLRVQASGEDATAILTIFAAEGAVSDLDVLATGDSSLAGAMVGEYGSSDLTITGDVLVRADGDSVIGEDSTAYGYVFGDNVELGTATRGTNLTVAAEGVGANAYLAMEGVSGHVDQVTVNADGVYSSSDLHIQVTPGDSLTIESIAVSASEAGATASADVHGASSVESNDWALDPATLGTVQVDGSIEVSATELDSNADLEINADKYDGLTVLGGGDITVTASETRATANLTVNHVSGEVGNVTVQAKGQPEVFGFNFFDYFDSDNGVVEPAQNETFVITVGSLPDPIHTFEFEIKSSQYLGAANLVALRDAILEAFNTQAEGLQFSFKAEYSGAPDFEQGLFVVWDTLRDEILPVGFNYDSSRINEDFLYSRDATQSSTASLNFLTDGSEKDVTMGSLSVTATAESSDAFANIEGFVALEGDVSVLASELSADAQAHINSDFQDDTVLGRVGNAINLSVTANNDDASADLNIGNASGHVAAMTVIASGANSSADLDLETTDLTAGSLSVTASSVDADASADIEGNIDVTGNIEVIARAQNGHASATLNETGSGDSVLGNGGVGGDLTVTASGEDADAHLHIHNASGTVGAIEVSSTEREADAELDLEVQSGQKLTIASVNVESGPDVVSEDSLWIDASMDVDGAVDIKGNISVSASGEDGQAHLAINEDNSLDAVVLGNGGVGSDLTVTASGEDADAHLHIHNASGAVGAIEVSSTEREADAELDLEVQSGQKLTIASVNVGSGPDVVSEDSLWIDAKMYVDGAVDIKGNISVSASGEDGEALLAINEGNSLDVVVLGNGGVGSVIALDASAEDANARLKIYNTSGQAGVITVDSSGTSAFAELDITTSDAGLKVASLTVTASSSDTYADADIGGPLADEGYSGGSLEIEGNVEINATGDRAISRGYLNHDTFEDTVFGDNGVGSDISVTASALLADSSLDIGNASGSVGSMDVTASGESSDAHLNLEVAQDATLTLSSLSVTGTKAYDADASISLRGANSFDTDPWTQPELTSGTIVINGGITAGITVTAQGVDSDVDLDINSDSLDTGATQLNVGQLTVQASATDADAEARIHNASGNVGNVNVTATGHPEVFGFDFLNYFGPEGEELLTRGTDFVLNVSNGDTQTFSIQSLTVGDEVFANLTSLLEHLVEEANDREDAQTRGYSFATSYPGAESIDTGLFVIWDDIRDDAPGFTLSFNSTPISLVANPYVFTQEATQRSDASLVLEVDQEGLTLNDLSVVADAESSDALANLSGVLSITGEIEVTAAELSSDAEGYINSNFNDTTTLGEVGQAINLTVTASGQSADAELNIGNASGTLDKLTVDSSGRSSDADLVLDINEDGVTATSLTVTASGHDAYASADVQGTIAISGNIDVTATAHSADANATINHMGSALDLTILGTALTGSNITVTASDGSSDAELFIDNAQGLVGAMKVTASGESSDAIFDFETTNTGVVASSLSVVAGSDDAFASADLDGTFTIKGDILASATGECTDAIAEIGFENRFSITLGDGQVGSNLTVIADGLSADSTLAIGGASGLVGDISVDAEGTTATADLALQLDGVIDGNISVSADGQNVRGNAQIDGDVAVRGDVTVTAAGAFTTAQANINAEGGVVTPFSLVIEEPIESVFGRTVSGDVLGSNLTVTAEGTTFAGLNVGSASGNLNAVTVDASGLSSDAILSLDTTDDGITMSSITVDASGEDTDAVAVMFGEISVTGNISVESSGEDSLSFGVLNAIIGAPDAQAQGTTTLGRTVEGESVGSDITVAATGEDFEWGGTEDVSENAVFVSQSTRGHVGELDVSSTGFSTDAAVLIGVKADETLTFDSLNITANSISGDASTTRVFLYGQDGEAEDQDRWTEQQDFVTDHGTVEITGNITVTASGTNDSVSVDVNVDGSLDLTGLPLGLDSTNRGYTVLGGGDITVLASATYASADLEIRNAQGSIDEIKVTAGGVSEVLGFDFLTHFSHIDGVEIENTDTFTFEVNGVRLTHEFKSANHANFENPTAAFVNDLLEELIAGLNAQAQEEGLGVHFSSDFDGASTIDSEAGLFAIWDTVRPTDFGTFSYSGGALPLELFFFRDGSENTHADFHLETENNGVTISSIAVVASGEDSYADFDIEGAGVRISGDISVVASEYDSRADADINDGEEDSIDGPTVLGNGNVGSKITVTASAESADAALDIEKASGTVSDMTAEALDDFASADLELWTTTDNLVANNLTVTAEGHSAEVDVSLDADGDLTLKGNIQITSEGRSADTDVDMYGCADTAHFMVEGDITATAISDDALARLEIVEEEDGNTRGFGLLTLGTAARGSNITLSTDGEDAQTHVHLFNAEGHVDDIRVESTGDDAWSHLELEAGEGRDLVIQSLTVRGIEGSGSSAEVEMWTASDTATLAIQGNIVVSAEEVNTLGSVDINNKSTDLDLSPTYSDGIVVFGNEVNGESVGSDITVTATATDASAEIYIYNATGAIGDITLSASGVSEMQGFDFLAYFDHEDGVEIDNTDTFSFTVNPGPDEFVLEHVFTAPDHTMFESPSAAFVRGLLDNVIESFNAQAEAEGLGITFVDTFNGKTGLFAVWDSIRPENTGVFNFDGSDLTDPELLFERDGSLDSYARFRMETEQNGVTISSIAVTSEAQSSDADFDIEGAGVRITGDISVVASEEFASADADINDGGSTSIDGPTVLGNGLVGSNITLTASAYSADADLDIEKASGRVRDMKVSASAEFASADLELWSNADGLEARTLTVVAEGLEASAEVEIDADGDFTLTGDIDITANGNSADADVEIHAKTADGHLFLQGDIRVTALSEDAGAWLEVIDEEDYISVDDVWVREEGQTTLGSVNTASDITVIADGQSADAHVHIYTAGGLVGAIDLQSSGASAEAHIELEAGANRDLSIESLSIRSITGESSEAYAELWTAADTANLSIKGDILLEAEGDLTIASLDINDKSSVSLDLDETLNLGTITFGDEVNGTTVGSNITVIASGDGSSADADIYTARGTVGNITVAAEGDSSGERLTGIYLFALWNFFEDEIKDQGWSADETTTVSMIFGDIEIVTPYDGANDADSFLEIVNEEAINKGLNASFELFQGSTLIVKWNNPSDAVEPSYALRNVLRSLPSDYSDFTYTEQNIIDAFNSDPDLNPNYIDADEGVSGISGDVVTTTASLDMELNGVIDGNIDVSAAGVLAESSVDLFGEMDLRGNVTVTASGEGAYVSADINRYFDESEDVVVIAPTLFITPQIEVETIQETVFGRTTGNTTVGSDITVSATGDDAEATLNVGYASGVVDAVSVSATGDDSDASLDVDVEANETLQINTISVLANSAGDDTAYADATFNSQLGYDDQDPFFDPLAEQSIDHGTVQINGDISVVASGLNDDATLNVNAIEGGPTESRLSLAKVFLLSLAAPDWATEVEGITFVSDDYDIFINFGDGIEPLSFLKGEFSPESIDLLNDYYADFGIQFSVDIDVLNYDLPNYPDLVFISENGSSIAPTLEFKFNDSADDNVILTRDFINDLFDSLGVPSEYRALLEEDIFTTRSASSGITSHTVLDGGDITVTASATGADADAYIHTASGNAGDVRVTSTGVSQVHGFDFLAYFDPTVNNAVNPNRLLSGDTFVVTICETTLTYAISANVTSEGQVNALLTDVVKSLNDQAKAAGINVTFASTFTDGPTPISTGLFAVWDSIREENTVEVGVRKGQSNAVQIENNDANAVFFWDREATIDNAAYLEVIAEDAKTLTVASVTVKSETEIAFNEVNEGNETHGAWADFYGDVHVTGDITVAATELNSYAETWMNNPDGTAATDLYGTTTLGLNDVGSNITVTASGQIAAADAQIQSAEGTVRNITVTASGDYKMFESDEGENSGSADLCTMDLVNSTANLNLHLNGAITGTVQVLATNMAAEASATLTGLEANINNVLLEATAQDAVAQASISFEDGVIINVNLNAEHHRSTVLIDIDQADPYDLAADTPVPVNSGDVTVQGEGYVGVTYYVDAHSSTAKNIDLSAMNEPLNAVVPADGESKDWEADWGYLDLDLVAKTVGGTAQAQQTADMSDLLPKMIHIKGFNVQRDSINLLWDDTPREDFDGVYFSGDADTLTAWGITSLVTEADERQLERNVTYQMALNELLIDAAEYFDRRSTDTDDYTVGYFYREITFKLGSDSDLAPTVTRSFMVYDHDVQSAGATGIISFGPTTGLTERNVAQRDTITHSYDSNDTGDTSFSDDWDGFHAITSLSVSGHGEDADVSYDLSDDADVMLGDITVRASSADGNGDDVDVVLYLDASTDVSEDDASLQLRQSNILVAADGYSNSASLDIDGAWGTIASLTLEATNGSDVSVDIYGSDNFESDDTYFGHGIFVQDVRVMAGGVDSDASLDLTVNGSIQTLRLEVLGEDSEVSADINQAEYGGQVFVSGSNLSDCDSADYCVDDIGDNFVTLVYRDATAEKITIDNGERSAGTSDDIEFRLELDGDGMDLFTVEDVWATRLTIEGWTENDSFEYLQAEDPSSTNWDFLSIPAASFDDLLGLALTAINRGGDDYYFGRTAENGYLFYDDDNEGVTGVVEFLNMTALASRQEYYDWLFESGSNTPPV